MKKCILCLKEKPLSEFYRNKNSPDGHATRCIPCNRKYCDAWNKANPEKVRSSWKKKEARYKATGIVRARRYGITIEQYNEVVKKHGGRCGICSLIKPLHVDHDHQTNVVRGLLCVDCNTAIGKLGDSIEGLERALNYLRAVSSDG